MWRHKPGDHHKYALRSSRGYQILFAVSFWLLLEYKQRCFRSKTVLSFRCSVLIWADISHALTCLREYFFTVSSRIWLVVKQLAFLKFSLVFTVLRQKNVKMTWKKQILKSTKGIFRKSCSTSNQATLLSNMTRTKGRISFFYNNARLGKIEKLMNHSILISFHRQKLS